MMLIMHPVIVLLMVLSFLYIAAEIDAAPMHGHATVPAADQCDWTERFVFYSYLYSHVLFYIIPMDCLLFFLPGLLQHIMKIRAPILMKN